MNDLDPYRSNPLVELKKEVDQLKHRMRWVETDCHRCRAFDRARHEFEKIHEENLRSQFRPAWVALGLSISCLISQMVYWWIGWK